MYCQEKLQWRCLLLFYYICKFLDDEVEKLHVFCDFNGGQNKNFTIIHFIHFIANKQIHGKKEIKITFPVRGHSYLYKNVGLWNFKEKMETPKDFVTMIQNVRKKPFPVEVVSVYKDLVYDWKDCYWCSVWEKCPLKTQPTKEITASTSNPRLITWRTIYNGPFLPLS